MKRKRHEEKAKRGDDRTRNVDSSHAVIWSGSGRGSVRSPVEIVFQPGIYSFNLIVPTLGGRWGSIFLVDIIDITQECFHDGVSIEFPTQLRLNRRCQIYATLNAIVYDDNQSWEVSITKLH